MRRRLIVLLLIVALTASFSVIGCGDGEEELTAAPARATWDTGWFPTEIFSSALQDLGYSVEDPLTLDNPAFYTSLAAGDVDFWVNGWFPLHNTYLEDIDEEVSLVGYVVEAGALQGYLIDKETSEQYEITNLEDFKDPEIAALFDSDGDGKANLVSCPPGWGCELVIQHHLDEYELRDYVNAQTTDYSIGMADAISRYDQGDSIFFYTWTPNWTINELVPGEDVVWLEVPYPSLPESQKDLEDATTLAGVVGCVDDPCEMGWPANDIRAVANNDFLAANPRAEALFEVAAIPLEDIAAQNALMQEGEDSKEDIKRHAQEWIEENQALYDSWIDAAMEAE